MEAHRAAPAPAPAPAAPAQVPAPAAAAASVKAGAPPRDRPRGCRSGRRKGGKSSRCREKEAGAVTSSVFALCAWLFQPADALALDGSSTQQRTTQWRKSIVNRELCFLVRAECQCAAMCIRSSGSRVGYGFGCRRERESEVIASKRERELRSMAGRESRPRERLCSVSKSAEGFLENTRSSKVEVLR